MHLRGKPDVRHHRQREPKRPARSARHLHTSGVRPQDRAVGSAADRVVPRRARPVPRHRAVARRPRLLRAGQRTPRPAAHRRIRAPDRAVAQPRRLRRALRAPPDLEHLPVRDRPRRPGRHRRSGRGRDGHQLLRRRPPGRAARLRAHARRDARRRGGAGVGGDRVLQHVADRLPAAARAVRRHRRGGATVRPAGPADGARPGRPVPLRRRGALAHQRPAPHRAARGPLAPLPLRPPGRPRPGDAAPRSRPAGHARRRREPGGDRLRHGRGLHPVRRVRRPVLDPGRRGGRGRCRGRVRVDAEQNGVSAFSALVTATPLRPSRRAGKIPGPRSCRGR